MNQTPNPKIKPFMTLHIPRFPTALVWAAREKGANQCLTMRQFVINAMEVATDTVGKHPNPPRSSNVKKPGKKGKKRAGK